MLTITILRAIFAESNTAIEYIPGEGAVCPICLKFTGKIVRVLITSTPAPQLRYCRCPVCSATLKAIQKEDPLPKPVTNTDQATKRKRRSKIKV